jgi:hypothetical protein
MLNREGNYKYFAEAGRFRILARGRSIKNSLSGRSIRIPLAPMGVLAPRLRTLDVTARPLIDTSEKISAHMSAESPLNISPNLSEIIPEVSEP